MDECRFFITAQSVVERLKAGTIQVLAVCCAHFTISFDGRELFSADDKTFAADGKVALWTKADSVTYFDTLTIRPL
jgi:hypothetical protein